MFDHHLNIQTEHKGKTLKTAAVSGSTEMIVGSLQVANMDTLSINTALWSSVKE